MKSWKLRALRFDLPSQEGSPDAIPDLIRFARDWGFTSLVLHFEGVIRTRALRHLSVESTYSSERIAEVVALAQQEGLEIIPVVGTLGHVEHLVEGPELRPLLGHGTRYKHLFCPSNDSTYEKLESYFAELSEIFPGGNFHIGGDEAWALGACPACRERLHRGESTENISLTHLLHLTTILRGIGKRAWIWDDVFEHRSAETMRRLPRDIVICSWRMGATSNSSERCVPDDTLRYLDEGFDVVVCPWTRSVENIARASGDWGQKGLLGGMITVWNLSTSFWPAFLPGAAFAARLWSDTSREPDLVLYETLRQLLPSLDQESLYGVCGVLSNPFWNLGPPSRYLNGLFSLEERRNLYSFVLYEELLHRAVRSLPLGLERSILGELHTQIQAQLRTARKRGWTPSSSEFIGEDEPEATSPAHEILDLGPATALEIHLATAPEDESPRRKNQEHEAMAMPPVGRALLAVRLSLATTDLEPTLHIEVEHAGKWKEIYLGTFKPFNSFISVYNLQLPLNWKVEAPDQLRFTVEGAGGDGILYAWLSLHDRTYRLRSLSAPPAPGSDAESILIDPAGRSIHGCPNLLRKNGGQPDEDRCVIEMKVESDSG